MQGNCIEVVPTFNPPNGHASLRSLVPGQCLLLADLDVMEVYGNLWLDRLYVRLTTPRGDLEFPRILWAASPAGLWMTGVTLQGNSDGVRDCDTCALDAKGLVHADGATTVTPLVP